MRWEIDWGGEEVIFGYEFADILIQGIEAGMGELEYLQKFGMSCDACGEFRLTQTCQVDESSPTDQGEEHRLMPYELCEECQRQMFTDV